MIEQMVSDKVCRKCGCTKPCTEFSVLVASKDGRHAYCKACRREYANQKTAECVRSDYTPRKRKPVESPTAWLLPRDPRPFGQKLAAATQHRHRMAYRVEPAQNLTWRIVA